MSLLDGLRALGSGIASLPGKLNEARFSHGTMNVPAASLPRQSSVGVNPDDLVVIGKDPDTGEDITIPQSQLGQFGMDPATGQVMGQKQVRTGPSKFGNFLSQGLPRMLDAGIAAATSPGDGSGGFLAALKGMDIGRDRLQKRDMLAYQMQRQRQQDAYSQEDRAARAAENRMQAEILRRKMDEGPADPIAPLKARAAAAGLAPGTPAYQDFMRSNGSTESSPKTMEQILVGQYHRETDPAKKAEIFKKLERLHLGSQPRDQKASWEERKTFAADLGLKPGTDTYNYWIANGKLPEGRTQSQTPHIQWGAGSNGKQQAYSVTIDSDTGQPAATPIKGMEREPRGSRGEGSQKRDPNRGTPHDFLIITSKKTAALRKAEQEAAAEADQLKKVADRDNSGVLGARLESDLAAVWSRLEKKKQQAMADYEDGVVALGGNVSPRGPKSKPPIISDPSPTLQRELPMGLQSPFPATGQEDWMRTKRGASLFR